MASDIEIEILEDESTQETEDFELDEISENIADSLTQLHLDEISTLVSTEYDIDEVDFRSRKQRIEALYKLALQVSEEKSSPWQGAANIKYPLITDAALGFSAMAGPSIIKDAEVVKAKVVGNDDGDDPIEGPEGALKDADGKVERANAGLKQRIADRISKFMSHQVLNDIEGWEEDMDKILIINPIVGCCFRKIYYDPLERKNVIRLVLPQYFMMDTNARTVESAERGTEVNNLYPHEIQANIAMGIFIDFDYGQSTEVKEDTYQDSDGEGSTTSQDESKPHAFVEVHRKLDLDDDGYPEPYIVWMHKETKKVVRIIARFDDEDILRAKDGSIIKIKAQNQYVKYGFIPDPEGSAYDIGFGHILQDLNNTVNTTINQLLDQGTLYTMGGGFIGDGLRMKSGEIKQKPGLYTRVKSKGLSIRENIVNHQRAEPSGTLMLLNESLVKAARDMSSMSKMLAGDIPANMPATTALASIEQGMQPFKAIFRRIHRSLKQEFKMLFELNRKYLSEEEYNNVLDDESANLEMDFNSGSVDVIPISDPDMLTTTQSFIRAEFLKGFIGDPYTDQMDLHKRIMRRMGEKDIDDLIKEPPPQQPDPIVQAQLEVFKSQVLDMKNKNTFNTRDADRKDQSFKLDIEKFIVQSKKDLSIVALNLEKAEAEADGIQMAHYKHVLEVETLNFDRLIELKEGLDNATNESG